MKESLTCLILPTSAMRGLYAKKKKKKVVETPLIETSWRKTSPTPDQTLPRAGVSAQPRPPQALSGACCARHMQDPNQTYSWQRYSFQRQACQGCPETGRKSAPELGVPCREDSSWKDNEVISGGSLDVKNMASVTGAGEKAACSPPGKRPSFDFFLFVPSQQNVAWVLTAFQEFPRGMAPCPFPQLPT